MCGKHGIVGRRYLSKPLDVVKQRLFQVCHVARVIHKHNFVEKVRWSVIEHTPDSPEKRGAGLVVEDNDD